MMRFQKTKKSLRALLPLAAVAALGVCLPQPGRAATYSYGSSARTINAGVLFLGHAQQTTANAPDPGAYVFQSLNLRPDVKPFGWNIVNPFAPRTVTQAIATRWPGTRTSNPTGYGSGQAVTADMAAYWEVPLEDMSADQLRRYDVLYLPLRAGDQVTPANNEKLRRFVDYGGTLLVEYYGAAGSAVGAPNNFFASLDTAAAPGILDLPAVGGGYLRSPLFLEPYAFDQRDFSTLGFPAGSSQTLSLQINGNLSDYWGQALVGTAGTAVYAGQDGAGVIVSSGLGVGSVLSDDLTQPALPFYGAYYPSDGQAAANLAPISNLKFLANVISYADSHPNGHKNPRQNGSAADLASFAPAWTARLNPGNAPTVPGGAAVWGKYVFVTDAYGVLRAFDAVPGEDLTGGGKADDGKIDLSSPTAPTSYDEVWEAKGPYASAPTVFSYGGSTYVMVADSKGQVYRFAVVASGVVAAPSAYPNAGKATFTSGPVPAPTYYGGRIYQGQADGSLYIYSLHSGASADGGLTIPLNPATAGNAGAGGTGNTPEPVTDAPAVGTIADGDVTNDIVALVPTTQNLYTVFLGARADLLSPFPRVGNLLGYNVNRGHLGQLNSLVLDAASVPKGQEFTLDGFSSVVYPGTNNPDFPAGTGASYYGSYDADFLKSTTGMNSGQTLTLNSISAFSYGAASGGGSTQAAAVSSPAGDRSGSFYYTVNTPDNQSYLIGLHPDVQQRGVHLTFRFRMPRGDGQADDPDGINWSALNGYSFVGAPVVDSSGRVYASATKGTNATVLCFDSTQDIYAASPGYDFSQVTVTQPDESGGVAAANTILAGGTVTNIPGVGAAEYGQYLAGDGRITFFNFGRATTQSRQIAGNLSEPQPVTVQTNASDAAPSSSFTMPLHTNLVWYAAPFPVSGKITGVSKVGDTVLLADSSTAAQTNTLYKLNARTTAGTGKMLPAAALSAAPLDISVGSVQAAPSASGTVLVLNGTTGISAFTRQLTLIADNNRILETDADGQAVWSADATVGDGGAKVGFSHPAALSLAASNDYLVADTGNNRCVRFDRGGQVLWELTRFSDPNHLLKAGSPLALSAPTSVQILRRGLSVSYLVADTGNSRIVEVTDTYNADGSLNPANYHVLTAATNTFDQQGRRYRYTSASYFPTANPVSILALVTNTRIAPLGAGNVLGPVSGDAPGGSMVSLGYDPAALTATAPANQNALTGFRAVYTSITVKTADSTGTVTSTRLPVRTPRFLSVYSPPSGASPSLLYADANGAFDLTQTAALTLLADVRYLQFSTQDYQAMSTMVGSVTTPLPNNLGNAVDRSNTPFVPTCIQRLDSGGSNPRYLITQTAGQSELGTPPAANGPVSFGGEIFEIDYSQAATPQGYTTQIVGYGNGPLSRPKLTGPLTQPTAALRQ